MRREFELYNELTHEQKIHLADFDIINSIENSTKKEFTQEEKETLLDAIKDAWLKDEESISLSTIADKIVEAYANSEISLDTLDNASSFEILDCAIGIESFEDLEESYSEER